MGKAGRDALRVGFDRTVMLEFYGATVSSDVGLFPFRDVDDASVCSGVGTMMITCSKHVHS